MKGSCYLDGITSLCTVGDYLRGQDGAVARVITGCEFDSQAWVLSVL